MESIKLIWDKEQEGSKEAGRTIFCPQWWRSGGGGGLGRGSRAVTNWGKNKKQQTHWELPLRAWEAATEPAGGHWLGEGSGRGRKLWVRIWENAAVGWALAPHYTRRDLAQSPESVAQPLGYLQGPSGQTMWWAICHKSELIPLAIGTSFSLWCSYYINLFISSFKSSSFHRHVRKTLFPFTILTEGLIFAQLKNPSRISTLRLSGNSITVGWSSHPMHRAGETCNSAKELKGHLTSPWWHHHYWLQLTSPGAAQNLCCSLGAWFAVDRPPHNRASADLLTGVEQVLKTKLPWQAWEGGLWHHTKRGLMLFRG